MKDEEKLKQAQEPEPGPSEKSEETDLIGAGTHETPATQSGDEQASTGADDTLEFLTRVGKVRPKPVRTPRKGQTEGEIRAMMMNVRRNG